MKNTIITTIKVVLFGVFLYNMGIYDLYLTMKHAERSEKDHYNSSFKTDLPFEKRMKKEQILNTLIREKTARAEKLGDAYGVKEYFTDMMDIKAKEVELQYPALGLQTMSLVNVRDGIWRNKKIDQTELEYWQDEIEKRYPAGHVLNSERDRTPIDWWHILSVICAWLLKIYLQTLPLACILFLLWNYEATKRWKLHSPFRLLLCVLAFPYFMIRQWLATVEMKRTKQYVTDILSKDELAAIKAFALGTGRLHEFRTGLEMNGKLRHSYCKVIIWLLAFNIMCVASFGYTAHIQQSMQSSKVTVQLIHHGNHVQPPPLDYATHHQCVSEPKRQ